MELTHHGIALDSAMATEKALTAGVDIDMMSHYYDAELPALVKSGRVPMPVVDEAVRRVLRVKFALGLFDHPFTEGPEVTGAVAEHRPLARRAAEESFVLLQNNPAPAETHCCPWPRPRRGSRSSARSPTMPAIWSAPGPGANNFGDVRTLRATMVERAQQSGAILTYEKGTEISGTSDSGFAAAVAAAQNSDVAILALGESSDMSGEAASRASPGPAREPRAIAGGCCRNRQACRPAHFLRPPAGARLGRSACAPPSWKFGSLGSKPAPRSSTPYSAMSLRAASSP